MASIDAVGAGVTVGTLDSYFTNIINNIMTVESQPLDTLNQKRDAIDVKRGAYTDVASRLSEFQTSLWALQKSDTSSLYLGHSAAVSGVASGNVVLTASASSDAVAGVYSLQISKLAQSHTVYGDQQVAADQDLTFASGSAGTFTIGGATFSVTQGVGITYTSGSSTGSVAGTSLNSLVSAINSATYASGSAVSASVVDRKLVLTSGSSGAAYHVTAGDGADGQATTGILHDLGLLGAGATSFKYAASVEAQDAEFTVNGISVKRSSNSHLTDVISGVSLNLAGDAVGKTATLTVANDTSAASGLVNDFISKFNGLTSYLKEKTGITSSTSNGTTTYTRGSLNGDYAFNDLRQNLFAAFMDETGNSGTLTNLRDLGLSMDDNLQLTVSDGTKLNDALNSNLSNAGSLLDAVSRRMDTLIGSFTGKTNAGTSTNGYMTTLNASLDSQYSQVNDSITSLTATLTKREQSLVDEYSQMQADLYLIQYQQQQWQSMSSYTTTA